MAVFQHNLPGCCSVGIMHHFGYYGGHIPEVTSSSKHFIAIFAQYQKGAFDDVCKKHTCVAAHRIPGAHGQDIAVCLFKKGKKK